jgi:phenylacetate-CoA ligase
VLRRSQLISLASAAKKNGGLDLMLRYNPVVRAKVLRLIRTFDRADAQGRQELTEALTARILKLARQTEYGRGRREAYTSWPVLTNTQLRDSPDSFARRGALSIPAATSGTTGLPIKLWRSSVCIAAEQAFLDHMVRSHGLTWAGARVATLRAMGTKSTSDLSPPYGLETHAGRRLVLSGLHLSAKTLPWFLDRLTSFRPDILWTSPTMGASLLHLMISTGQHLGIRIPLILTSSAHFSPELREAMEREWGGKIFDYYGQAERVCFAVSSRAGEFWFNPAYGRVELTPSETDELTDGNRQISIVATGFWNSAMPLVRYDTGDRAIVPATATETDLRAISLGLQPFGGIASRTDDFIVTSEGLRIGSLNAVPWEVENLLQVQIVQESLNSVVVRALTLPRFSAADCARLEANARAKLPRSIAVRVEVVDRLQVGAHGKTPFVVRQIDQPPSCSALPTRADQSQDPVITDQAPFTRVAEVKENPC